MQHWVVNCAAALSAAWLWHGQLTEIAFRLFFSIIFLSFVSSCIVRYVSLASDLASMIHLEALFARLFMITAVAVLVLVKDCAGLVATLSQR